MKPILSLAGAFALVFFPAAGLRAEEHVGPHKGAIVEWGEGIVERLSERHLDIRLERGAETEVRTAIWRWSRS